MSKKPMKLERGEGTFRVLKSGKINYRKYVHLDNGDIKEVCVTGKTEAECIKKMVQKEDDVKKNINKTRDKALADAMYEWIETVKKPVLAAQSYDTLLKTVKNQIATSAIGNVLYASVSAEELQHLINKLNEEEHYSKSIIRKTYLALNAFYKYKSKTDKFNNPMALVVMPANNNIVKATKEIKYMTEEQSVEFVRAATATYKTGRLIFKFGPMIAANLFLGLRISELLALQWKDIDLEKNIIIVNKTIIDKDNPEYKSNVPELMKQIGISKKIHVIQNYTKTKKTRYVTINDNARELILYYMKFIDNINPDDFVMKTSCGGATNISGVAKTVQLIQKQAGLDIIITGTHSLRHTCATFYFSMGVPIEIIADVLGNSREVCESTYVHIMEENKREAAAKINLPGVNLKVG